MDPHPVSKLQQIENLPKLVPGSRNLSPEEVEHSQRARLIAAMAHEVAARGYAATTVQHIVATAGTSKTAFYRQFPSKEDCYLAGLEAVVAEVNTILFQGFLTEGTAEQRFRNGFRDYLELLASGPDYAQTFLVEFTAAGPRAAALRARQLEQAAGAFTAWQREMRKQEPELDELNEVRAMALIAGVRELVSSTVLSAGVAALGTNVEEITDAVLSMGGGTLVRRS